MELGLSLGENSRPFSFREEPREASNLGFNSTLLSIGPVITKQTDQHQEQELLTVQRKKHKSDSTTEEDHTNKSLLSPSASLKANNKLDFLPHFSSGGSSRGFDVNMPAEDEVEEVAALSSSPNSVALMDFCMFSKKGRRSDEDENRGRTRKRLRLSKEQFSFLEESFKDHNTLNPKQKIALGKQLHLHPRQIEVWFQNRRARTKLKKIELDCKYLKKCCDTLTEENTRLHKELQELRALKTSIDD